MKNRIEIQKRIRWSDCHKVSELAMMLDAMPPGLRKPLLESVLVPTKTDFQTSYMIGTLRTLLSDSLFELFGTMIVINGRAIRDFDDCDQLFRCFESCDDPAKVQLAVCDLLETLADHPMVERSKSG